MLTAVDLINLQRRQKSFQSNTNFFKHSDESFQVLENFLNFQPLTFRNKGTHWRSLSHK